MEKLKTATATEARNVNRLTILANGNIDAVLYTAEELEDVSFAVMGTPREDSSAAKSESDVIVFVPLPISAFSP